MKKIVFCGLLIFFTFSCSKNNETAGINSEPKISVFSIDNYFLYLKKYLHQSVPVDAEQRTNYWGGPTLIYLREIDTTQEYKIREEFRATELSDDTVVKAALIMEGTNESIKMFYTKLSDTLEYLGAVGEFWTAYKNHDSWRDELLKIPEYLEEPSNYYNMIAWKYDELIFLIEIYIRNNNSTIEVYIMDDDYYLFGEHTGA